MLTRTIFILAAIGANLSASPMQWTVETGGNGNYYEYISAPSIFQGLSFDTARSAAESSSFNGLNGYLVTITSAQENDFIRGAFPFLYGFGATSSIWLGATDLQADQQFQWIAGPESGQLLSYNDFGPGQPVGAGQPNFVAMVINAATVGAPPTSSWVAYTTGDGTLGYVVEYGAGNSANSAVPEPSTWVLVGFAFLVGLARKRLFPPHPTGKNGTARATL